MPDVIHLLTDSVANQIAAGEVVQRPASVVKELLENSIDAGSQAITLHIKEAGKSFIQVADDGCGMSETDARMSFERHATSKIIRAEDLFNIHSLGFRGEAIPSIASVAKVEMRTRRKEDDAGTLIIMEGGTLKTHEPVACNPGTIITVKNLFYNIPVRKNFLKSDSIEFRNILETFQNIALANPDIKFVFINERNEIFHLNKGTFRFRLTGVLGKRYDHFIVPVSEKTPIVNIEGFIGKPDAAKKSKGEQYLFVNKRFIKNPYFNHAIMAAFEGLLAPDTYPFYAIFLEVPSEKIDVNVHPTKTEVKFEEERAIYLFLKTTLKKSLSQHHIAPSLDFEQEAFHNKMTDEKTGNEQGKSEQLQFETGDKRRSGSVFPPSSSRQKTTPDDWKELFKILDNKTTDTQPETVIPGLPTAKSIESEDFLKSDPSNESHVMQMHQKFIFTPIHSGFMLVHQQYAHQRILYEEYLKALKDNLPLSQKQLFPEVLEFSKADFETMTELKPELEKIGFDLDIFGKTSFIINGLPADFHITNCREFIENMMEDYKNSSGVKDDRKNERIARALSVHAAIKPGVVLSVEEMSAMIDKLFACENPYFSPAGKPTLLTINKSEIEKKFEKN